jgi:uncharacterized protein YegP (UPF0339 family)
MTAKFEISKSKANQNYYFRLRVSNNGEIILASEGYTTKDNCRNGIASVKVNSPSDSNYDRLTANNGQYYFNLKSSGNYQIIGTSEMYASKQGRDIGIESVKRNAPTADVVDLTEAVYS